MAQFKVKNEVTNRGGKVYTAVDGFITVPADEVKFFEGWKDETVKATPTKATKKKED